MSRVAVIDAKPSRNKYEDYFQFPFDLFHLCSRNIPKILKKDVDIEVDLNNYDYVILIGSEATKHYAKVSVSAFAGILIDDKYLALPNPAMFIFKPEGKPEFERNLAKVNGYVSGERKNVVKTGDFKGLIEPEEIEKFLKELLALPSNSFIAIDTETSALDVRRGHILGISMSYKKDHGRYICTDYLSDYLVDMIQLILDNSCMVFHNRKFDEKWLNYHFKLKFKADSHDTMVMHYVLDETQGSHGLKLLALKHTDYGDYEAELDEFKKDYCAMHGISKDDFSYEFIPFEIISRYASIDTAVTLELFLKFHPIVSAHPKLGPLYRNIMIPATKFLMDMEENGIPMSRSRLEAANAYLEKEIAASREAIYSFKEVHAMEADKGSLFNPASVQQLREILFRYLGLEPTGKLTDTGAISTDSEVLEELSKVHDLPKALLKTRKLSKVRNTYVDKILPALDRDGRIRTNFNLIFTTSGRLSSSGKFNAQQIPRDDPIIKGCIKADEGYKIVSQDQ